jgi:hypothetical protein
MEDFEEVVLDGNKVIFRFWIAYWLNDDVNSISSVVDFELKEEELFLMLKFKEIKGSDSFNKDNRRGRLVEMKKILEDKDAMNEGVYFILKSVSGDFIDNNKIIIGYEIDGEDKSFEISYEDVLYMYLLNAYLDDEIEGNIEKKYLYSINKLLGE